MHDPNINYKKHPEKYRIGPGEKGVLTVEPCKSEILPHWTFKTPDDAEESSEKIYDMFIDYLREDDFVGADMARKFLRMGMTRARRYARHASGRKYDDEGNERPENPDPEKQKSSDIFQEKWKEARENEKYLRLKEEHRNNYY
ncbi:DUF4385 domain-containing protein [Rhodohalobacter sp. 8-1]|uniref:DUF4385 domain-containing protein n=1 Tax=Rhodohalobacter sp. 8-1 TaxID=3131972 RepID=UPI0030EF1645